jgi:hypothetical protein
VHTGSLAEVTRAFADSGERSTILASDDVEGTLDNATRA